MGNHQKRRAVRSGDGESKTKNVKNKVKRGYSFLRNEGRNEYFSKPNPRPLSKWCISIWGGEEEIGHTLRAFDTRIEKNE